MQRAPVTGEVIAVQHRPGRFGSADLASASTENERTSMRIRTASGAEVVAVQIAGLLARRIVCHAHVGDKLSIGDTYGLIRFGSRLDTYLPPGTEPLVKVGQRADRRRDGAGRAAMINKPRGRRGGKPADPAQRDDGAVHLRGVDVDQVRRSSTSRCPRWR